MNIQSLRRPDHAFLSFLVCRNPVEKLLSVYRYMVDMAASDSQTFRERPDFPRGGPAPSWDQFVSLVAARYSHHCSKPRYFSSSDSDNYLGLMRTLAAGCDPCSFHYDAVVRMESYEEDSRALLDLSGLSWVGSNNLDTAVVM